MTLRSVLPITFFRKELRFPNPMHRALKTCQKPRVITRRLQLFTKKRCWHLNTGQCSTISHQLAHIRHFKGRKVHLIFHPVFALFSLPVWLPKAIIIPWKCLLRVPWWNTFQWGPKKPPKPLLPKIKFQAPNPKSQSQPSVHWLFIKHKPLIWGSHFDGQRIHP